MAHIVSIWPRAQFDMRVTFVRIGRTSSPATASNWYAGILRKIRSLANNPEMWPFADEAVDLGLELRELLYGRRRQVYRILFTIDGQTVNVHRVRHAAQDRLSPGDI